jgi:hypothetical protein
MVTSHCFGYKIYYDLIWRYCDNHIPINAEKRKCPRCNQRQTLEGYDPCTGYVKNATSICCGHGITKSITIY